LTAGFFSKDAILWNLWSHPAGMGWLWGMGVLGVFLTALYSFRAFFFIFYGEQTTRPNQKTSRPVLLLPVIILAGFSLVSGWVEWPRTFGDVSLFRGFIHTAIPEHRIPDHLLMEEIVVQAGTTGIVLMGILMAYVFFLRHPVLVEAIVQTTAGKELRRAAFRGWEFNRLYNWLFVQPFLKTVRASKDDPIDRLYQRLVITPYVSVANINKDDVLNYVYYTLVKGNRACHLALRHLQNGRVRWYAQVLGFGSAVMIGLVIFL
jgi:NADH-quinone oxidoreductase subunit L